MADDWRITDLTPLEGMRSEELNFEPSTVTRGMEVFRAMKSLKQINFHEVDEFWESHDAGRFDDILLPTWMFGWNHSRSSDGK